MERDIRLEELNELREQLTLLNQKLEKQSIINHQLIRNSIKERISNINRTGIALCALVIITTPFIAISYAHYLNFSLALNIFTCAFMAIALVYTIWSHWGLNSNLLNGDLITASTTIMRTRRRYKQWSYFSYPWLIVWLCWNGWEVYSKIDNREMLLGIIVGSIIGLIIGGIYGWRQRNKIYRNIDAMLQDIADLKSEE
jgi:Mn2+/Fe2+ NRAMP family transporter